jgi:enamine deaminase RidA (YjgF/YER057c/UK114 family)
MTRRAVSSDQAPEALGPYSQAIVAGEFVFCSGMAGSDRGRDHHIRRFDDRSSISTSSGSDAGSRSASSATRSGC